MTAPIVFISHNRVKMGMFDDINKHYRDSNPRALHLEGVYSFYIIDADQSISLFACPKLLLYQTSLDWKERD